MSRLPTNAVSSLVKMLNEAKQDPALHDPHTADMLAYVLSKAAGKTLPVRQPAQKSLAQVLEGTLTDFDSGDFMALAADGGLLRNVKGTWEVASLY